MEAAKNFALTAIISAVVFGLMTLVMNKPEVVRKAVPEITNHE